MNFETNVIHLLAKSVGVVRFIIPQETVYYNALLEIKMSKKLGCLMSYIFPNIKGVGSDDMMENYYAIQDLTEATEYFRHPILGKNLVEISIVLLTVKPKTIHAIFEAQDNIRLHSCLTLFAHVEGVDSVFNEIIEKIFRSNFHSPTLNLLCNI